MIGRDRGFQRYINFSYFFVFFFGFYGRFFTYTGWQQFLWKSKLVTVWIQSMFSLRVIRCRLGRFSWIQSIGIMLGRKRYTFLNLFRGICGGWYIRFGQLQSRVVRFRFIGYCFYFFVNSYRRLVFFCLLLVKQVQVILVLQLGFSKAGFSGSVRKVFYYLYQRKQLVYYKGCSVSGVYCILVWCSVLYSCFFI